MMSWSWSIVRRVSNSSAFSWRVEPQTGQHRNEKKRLVWGRMQTCLASKEKMNLAHAGFGDPVWSATRPKMCAADNHKKLHLLEDWSLREPRCFCTIPQCVRSSKNMFVAWYDLLNLLAEHLLFFLSPYASKWKWSLPESCIQIPPDPVKSRHELERMFRRSSIRLKPLILSCKHCLQLISSGGYNANQYQNKANLALSGAYLPTSAGLFVLHGHLSHAILAYDRTTLSLFIIILAL